MNEEALLTMIVMIFYVLILGVLMIGAYIYTSLVLSKIASKLGYTDTWKAWIPFVKGAYHLELGNFSPWLYLLILLPVFGWIAVSVLSIIAWFNIAEKRGFPVWIGLIAGLAWLVPNGGLIAQYISHGYIAWGEYEKK